MDEHLFITMAKLKADRLKLEREQGAARAVAEPGAAAKEAGKQAVTPPRKPWRGPRWREQS